MESRSWEFCGWKKKPKSSSSGIRPGIPRQWSPRKSKTNWGFGRARAIAPGIPFAQGSNGMLNGSVQQICISPAAGAAMQLIDEVKALPGRGLAGDRYGESVGFYSNKPGPDREITLIEQEAIDALSRESGISLEPK